MLNSLFLSTVGFRAGLLRTLNYVSNDLCGGRFRVYMNLRFKSYVSYSHISYNYWILVPCYRIYQGQHCNEEQPLCPAVLFLVTHIT